MTTRDDIHVVDASATVDLTLPDLPPTPADLWDSMMRFSGPADTELKAMRKTVDVLLQHAYEMVVATYEYLQRVPETAAILGWDHGVDEAHLAERRRFFAIWLARTLSIDLGTDFAGYLFHAGQMHAGHGPRHIHTPARWITGSMGLVLGAFAGYIQQAHSDAATVAPALAGWNKYLMIQLNQMQAGYETGCALDDGDLPLLIKAYGRVRQQWGRESIVAHYRQGACVGDVLRKLVNYAPLLRDMLFEQTWQAPDEQALWMAVKPVYVLRDNWRILLNGQDLRYYGGFTRTLKSGDTLDLFPPGR